MTIIQQTKAREHFLNLTRNDYFNDVTSDGKALFTLGKDDRYSFPYLSDFDLIRVSFGASPVVEFIKVEVLDV